jgi:hypothetical protein
MHGIATACEYEFSLWGFPYLFTQSHQRQTLQAVAEETRIRTGFENAVETAAAELSVALERGSSLQKDLQEVMFLKVHRELYLSLG